MNEFKTILTKLKEIIKQQVQTDKKVLDKDIASVLGMKPATFASYKSRDKPPYQAILSYCHENRLNVRKILFDEADPIIDYPGPAPVEAGKVRVKYFRTLEVYASYLKKYPISSSKILEIL
jgi:hypothetical protein